MTESSGYDLQPGTDDAGPGPGGYQPTGNPTVDTVLESLERLDHVPVSEHAATFEAAHERLRGALADAGEQGDAGRTS